MSTTVNSKISLANFPVNHGVYQVIKKITSSIPHTLHGPDRVSYLIDTIPSILYEEKDLLIALFNTFLSEMVRREASDIEVGGYGSNGSI